MRSYQRIFRPDRRLYQVEGRRLPVPGGVPLRWLGWFVAALLLVLASSARSPLVAALAGLFAGVAALAQGGPAAALICGLAAPVVVGGAGLVLGLFDWPLRLVVVPALIAMLGTQATPDGRRADRYAWSWLGVRLASWASWRPLLATGLASRRASQVWVAACGGPVLRRGRVRGPARVSFYVPVTMERSRWRPGRLLARPIEHPEHGVRAHLAVELVAGESLELRP